MGGFLAGGLQEGITERSRAAHFAPHQSQGLLGLLKNKNQPKMGEGEETQRTQPGLCPVGGVQKSSNSQIIKALNPYTAKAAEEENDQLHPGMENIRSLPTQGLNKSLTPGNTLPSSWGQFLPTTEATKLCKINLVAPGKDSAAPPVILAPHNRGYRQIPKRGTLPQDRQCHTGAP